MVDGSGASFYRRAACKAQGTDHLHLAVGVFWLTGRCTRKYRACCCLSIYGIGLARAVLLAALGADHLRDLHLLGLQKASEASAEAARTFYSGML